MDRLIEIKKRLQATTPGVWDRVEESDSGDWIVSTDDGRFIAQTSYDGLSQTVRDTCKADADFIAHAREDIAYLLERLEINLRE